MQQILRRGSNVLCLVFLFSIYLSVNSCVPAKTYVYFHDLQEDTLYPADVVIQNPAKFTDPRIEPNDILAINIQTLLQNESNAPVEATSSPTSNLLGGFLVNKKGEIELSLIGFVKVGGLTTSEASELIKSKANDFYKDAVVKVRIANFDVVVAGDVLKPGRVNIPSEKATILDVLAEVGDVGLSGKRTNVLLKRTEGDQTRIVRLDLTKSDIFSSPYFYVKQRDYIYVEPNNFKRQTSNNSYLRYLSYGSAVLGIVSLLFITKIVK